MVPAIKLMAGWLYPLNDPFISNCGHYSFSATLIEQTRLESSLISLQAMGLRERVLEF